MVNRQQFFVCQMVGAALFGSSLPDSSDVDWNSIHQEFADQAIIAIPATILEHLPMPKDILNQWQIELINESARSIKLIANQDELVQLLIKHDIPYVILKGLS